LYIGTDGKLHAGFWDINHPLVVSGNVLAADGRWQHVAIVGEPPLLRLYHNGFMIGEVKGKNYCGNVPFNQLGAGIGSEGWLATAPKPWYFEGRLRDFRVWGVPRTARQIRAHLNRPLTGNEPGLAAYYPMDRVEGNRLLDRSRDGMDGSQDGILGGGDDSVRPSLVADASFAQHAGQVAARWVSTGRIGED
jgi:hypothetical protein